ncbi:MAG TPA: dTDP-4-dehydrorhamnose reductase [Acidothermaceae bacterium]
MTERWLVVGAGGQLGTDLMRVLDGQYVIGLTRHELDITDVDAVARAVAAVVPSVIVNAAAYTAVDAAETDEATAFAANVTAPAALAAAAAKAGAKFVHVSTDYVFAGDATVPYDEAAATGPRSAYGRTKLAGEQAVFAELPSAYVVRTAWVYGASGANFVKTMARLERERETVSVVDDQRGSPTWSRDLARGLVELGSSGAAGGVYHCTNTGETTWFGFTRAIFEELGADPERVLPTTTAAFPRPAPRPAYSVLGNRRWIEAGLDPLPHWRTALHDAFASAPDELRGAAK